MNRDQTITLYKWILKEFTVRGRAEDVAKLGPELASLIRPGDRVLDLCCGGGPFSFYLEEKGAKVTGIDFAPYMIQLAREEAKRRASAVNFVLGDVLTDDLGVDYFDLVVFLGNTVSDFPPSSFLRLGRRVSQALKPKGRFAIQYIDGVLYFQKEKQGGVQQEEPQRITWRFKEYVPEKGAYVLVYKNESTGEEYEYTSYVYTRPLLRLLMAGLFRLERSIQQSELDVFLKRPHP